MIVYNITTKVEPSVAPQWLHWLRAEHAPQMLATGCFQSYQVLRLLELDDTEGPTFAVQYQSATKAAYQTFARRFAEALERQAVEKWGGRVVSFGTLMQLEP